MILFSGEGPGLYARIGGGFGGDVGASGELGTSTNLDAFGGKSLGAAASVFGPGGSFSTNGSGKTFAVTMGPRLNPETALLPIGEHVEASYTAKITALDVIKAVGKAITEAVNELNKMAGLPRAY